MSRLNNIPLFGFEIFKEVEMELEQVKNIFPYSNNKDLYNSIVELCIEKVKQLSEKKRSELENKIWD